MTGASRYKGTRRRVFERANSTWAVENDTRVAPSSDFGALLRRYRHGAGLSQEALAERAGVSANGISALERGDRRTPHRDTLGLLSAALELTDEQRAAFEEAASHSALRRRDDSLPLALTSFVGREHEIADLAGLLREHRFVTITGAGGIGKTQTALRVAAALQDDGIGSVYFVPLAPVGDASRVVSAIAGALGVQEVPQRTLQETLLTYLHNKKLLLVIDNAEHVVEEAARIVEVLLQGVPELRVLATSRVGLRVGGERVYRLPSLQLADAVRLFADRAQSVNFHFALTEDKAAAATSLCRRLDCIPLAIELAAARVDALPVRTLARDLESHLNFPAASSGAAPSRQLTMRATIDWSYLLLSAEEQRVFESLSAFAGGCTLDAATTVCAGEGVPAAEVPNLLSSLIMKSLVLADLERDDARYRLLEPFRTYAWERLGARGEQRAIAARHALASLERANRFNDAWEENELDSVCASMLRDEMDNWRKALDWTLVEGEDVVLGQELAGKLVNAWLEGELLEGRRWTRLALEAVDDTTPANVVARLADADARLSWSLNDPESAISSGDRAIALYRESGDLLGIARTQPYVGLAYSSVGRHDEARRLLEEGLAAARDVDNPSTIAYALRCLGVWKSAFGEDPVAGRRDVLEALSIYEACGPERRALYALVNLSSCCCVDDPESGLLYASRVIEGAQRIHFSSYMLASALDLAGMYALLLERYDEALETAGEALALAASHDVGLLTDEAVHIVAGSATLRPQPEEERSAIHARAARLFGFAPTAHSSWPYQPLGRLRDTAVALLDRSLGAQRLESIMAEGAAMSREAAIAEALALCE